MADRLSCAEFPDRANVRLRAGQLEARDVRAVAGWLAVRHAGASPAALHAGLESFFQDLERCVSAVGGAFPEFAAQPLDEIEVAQRDFLEQQGGRLGERAFRVRVGLGSPLALADLRIGNEGTVECLRTGDARRDVAPRDGCADAAGIALDLARGRRGDLAELLLSTYAAAADDFELYGVVDFFERAVALERAADASEKIAAGRVDRAAVLDDARQLLLVALGTRRRPLLPPVLVAVGGLVASGKSTVSTALAERLGAPRIEADRVHVSLLKNPADRSVHESQWARSFASGFSDEVYAELLRRAEIVLDSGRPVVLDACFPTARQRMAARSLARARSWPFLFVECRAEEATRLGRLAARDARSERGGWLQIHRDLAARWQTPNEFAAAEVLTLDTDRPLSEAAAALDARLPTWPTRLKA